MPWMDGLVTVQMKDYVLTTIVEISCLWIVVVCFGVLESWFPINSKTDCYMNYTKPTQELSEWSLRPEHTLVKSCPACQALQKDQPAVPLKSWPYSSRCWERIHIDFADFLKRQYLIVIDSYSKWIESRKWTRQLLIRLSRNSDECCFPRTTRSLGLRQRTTAHQRNHGDILDEQWRSSYPYHPASNGAAEHTVQTVKFALKKYLLAGKERAVDMDCGLQSFLLHYRNTPQATTGRSPAELFLKSRLRTRFSLLKPDVISTVHQKQDVQKQNHDVSSTSPAQFSVGEIVRVKSTPQYGGVERYVKGAIAKVVGAYCYIVRIGNRCRFVHLNHLRKTGEFDDRENYLNIPTIVPPNVPQLVPPFAFPVTPNTPTPSTAPVAVDPDIPNVPDTTSVVPGEIQLSQAGSPTVAKPSPRIQSYPTDVRRSIRDRKPPKRLIETM